MAGLFLSPSLAADENRQATEEDRPTADEDQRPAQPAPPDHFLFRNLGDTGLCLPIVSMGVMNSDNPNLIRAALDAGIVHLDTAWWYMGGRNEETIGQVLQGRPRDSFVIATKVPGSVPLPYATGCFPDDAISQEHLGSAFIERFETSLDRLQLDYVDILYLHNVWTREAAQFEPLLQILDRLRHEGRARFIGLSTHRNEPLVIDAAIDAGIYDVILTAYNFQQDHRDQVREAIARADQAGLGVIAMKAMAGGYLDEAKKSPVNAPGALKWVLRDEHVHTAISGMTTFEQLQMDLSVMKDLSLSDQDKKDLQLESSLPESAPGDLYCQGCGNCLDRCAGKLPIPELMRAYMYARGYGNYQQARELVLSLELPENPCHRCQRCNVVCRRGFDVAGRIREVLPLRHLSPRLLS
jgi:hypothetical protein